MKNFKEYIKEEIGELGDPNDRKMIERWFYDHLKDFRPGKLYIEDDGGLTYNSHMIFKKSPGSKLPYKFHTIGGDLKLSFTMISSFENFPKKINGDLIVMNGKIVSLDGIPEEVNGNVNLWGNKIRSVKDIHKKLKRMNGTLTLSLNPIKGPILGCLLIDGVKEIYSNDFQAPPVRDVDKLEAALHTISKYVGQGRAGVIDAQEKLDELDLGKFAEI